VTSEEMKKVSEFVTFKFVALVKSHGFFALCPISCVKGELCMLFGLNA
jgi:hypothetical protein